MSIIKKVKNFPINPGCYIFKNRSGKIIYVGKAKNLKKRVISYWQKKDRDSKTQKLIKEIASIEYFITDSEVEALLLEARLIRENRPKYNIVLKDSIRYAYLKITNEKFPRLLTVRKTNIKGNFFGPYADGSARARIALMTAKLFKFRTCKRLSKKACLQYHIGNCQAPCVGLISEQDYNKNIKAAKLFLKGDIKKLVRDLQQRMKQASNAQNYEQAQVFRDQLKALDILQQRQKVDLLKKINQDAINFIIATRGVSFSAPSESPRLGGGLRRCSGKALESPAISAGRLQRSSDKNKQRLILQVFHIKKGTILNKEEFKFANGEVDKILPDFIKQYYATNDIPHEIILPQKLKEQNLIKKYLEKLAKPSSCAQGLGKHKVQLTVPQKGVKKKLLEMIKNNLILSLESQNQPLVDLRDKLNLAALPRMIECFDVSNLGSSDIVASVVCFKDGCPDKSSYRKFKIKTTNIQDDFAAIGEVVERRYSRSNGSRTPKKEVRLPLLPDLIVVDGGLGQLHSAQEKLEKLNLPVPVIGLAKREELIYTLSNNQPIKLSKKSAGLKLLQHIRDEAHRFTVSFHRQRRRMI
jgi:excinuclease ABC subunit C